MSLIHAIILGVIEGLTEFFPISSTGHLIVAERVLGIAHPSLFFNVVIQLGAILAVVVYYRKYLGEMLRSVFTHPKKNRAMYFGVATIPALVVGVLFHKQIEMLQTSVRVVGIMTIAIAVLMIFIERISKATLEKGRLEKDWTWKDYLTIGLFQSLSVIPGTSRSGITILGGITQKLSFKSAVDIAFILGIPAMGAAAVFESLKLLSGSTPKDQSLVVGTSVGFVTAFVVAFGTIYFTLPILRRYGFMPFIVYRILLGVFLLLFFR